jgi:hypothetical protein
MYLWRAVDDEVRDMLIPWCLSACATLFVGARSPSSWRLRIDKKAAMRLMRKPTVGAVSSTRFTRPLFAIAGFKDAADEPPPTNRAALPS